MAPQGKQLLERLFVPALVALVGVAAFGLGRLSALSEIESGFVIHEAPGQQGR